MRCTGGRCPTLAPPAPIETHPCGDDAHENNRDAPICGGHAGADDADRDGGGVCCAGGPAAHRAGRRAAGAAASVAEARYATSVAA